MKREFSVVEKLSLKMEQIDTVYSVEKNNSFQDLKDLESEREKLLE